MNTGRDLVSYTAGSLSTSSTTWLRYKDILIENVLS